VIIASRGSSLLLANALLYALACGSSSAQLPTTIACTQSLADYCAASLCVQHIELSPVVGDTEQSFCAQCGAPCKSQLYQFEDCTDGTLALESQVGMASESKGIDVLTYYYDPETLDLTAVLDSTMGGTYKASLTCVGGPQTVSGHVCAPGASFQCP
jgi:hypothetical protein